MCIRDREYNNKIFLDGVINRQHSSISEILKFLRDKYCGSLGHEYMHISNPTERKWFRDRVEKTDDFKFTQNGKEAILKKLIQAEGFEKFLHTKYVGTKRFGLDGGESLIPALEQIIKIGGQSQVKEVKIGMSHRGRLNVLANVLQKSYKRKVFLDGVINKQESNITEILEFLREKYCGPLGYEYMHISNPTERKWFRDRVEKTDDFNFTQNGKEAILNKLIPVSYTHLTLPTIYSV